MNKLFQTKTTGNRNSHYNSVELAIIIKLLPEAQAGWGLEYQKSGSFWLLFLMIEVTNP